MKQHFEIMTYASSIKDKNLKKKIYSELQEFVEFKHVLNISHSHQISPDGSKITYTILVHFLNEKPKTDYVSENLQTNSSYDGMDVSEFDDFD